MSSRHKPEKGRKRSPEPAQQSRAILLARQGTQTLSWLLVVFIACFVTVQCDRYIALRRIEAPPSSAAFDAAPFVLIGAPCPVGWSVVGSLTSGAMLLF